MSLTLEEMLDAAAKLNGGWIRIGEGDYYHNAINSGFERSFLYVQKTQAGYTLSMSYKDVQIGKHTGPEIQALFEAAERDFSSVISPVDLKRKMKVEKKQKWCYGVFREIAGGNRQDQSPLTFEEIHKLAENMIFTRKKYDSSVEQAGSFHRYNTWMSATKRTEKDREAYSVNFSANPFFWASAHYFVSGLSDEQNKAIFELLESEHFRKKKEREEIARLVYVARAREKIGQLLPGQDSASDFSIDEIESLIAKSRDWKREVVSNKNDLTKKPSEMVKGYILDGNRFFFSHPLSFITSKEGDGAEYSFSLSFDNNTVFCSTGNEAERLYNLALEGYSTFKGNKEAADELKKAAVADEYRGKFTTNQLPLRRRLGR